MKLARVMSKLLIAKWTSITFKGYIDLFKFTLKHPKEPRSKKVLSNVKILLTVFFVCNGGVHHEFLPHDSMVNKEYYRADMRRLNEAIPKKRTGLWKN